MTFENNGLTITNDNGYLLEMGDIGYKVVDRDGNTYIYDPHWYKIDKEGNKSILKKEDMNESIRQIIRDESYANMVEFKRFNDDYNH